MLGIQDFGQVVNSFQFSIFVLLGTPLRLHTIKRLEVVNSFQFSIFVLLGTPTEPRKCLFAKL